jgi:RNA polymerase sigma factor (sigma-70 family)
MTAEEYNACVDSYADRLYRFVLKNMKSVDKANDVVQDTFEKMWEKVSEIENETVKSYMYAVAYNLMLKELKKASFEVGLEGAQETDSMHNEQYSDSKEVIKVALQRLPEKQRSALMFRDYEGYSYEAIAKIMQTDKDHIKKYIFRGRIALKKHLVSLDNVI